MQQLPEALQPLAAYSQFLLFRSSWDATKQKYNKFPINSHTLQAYPKGSNWQADPAQFCTTAESALALANVLGPDYGVGFLFTPADPFFFVDIDSCLQPDGASWSPLAMDLLAALPGAAVEVSHSGKGLHIFGTSAALDHGCRNDALGLEFYTQGRFVALTGTNAIGNASTDCSVALPGLVAKYFPAREAGSFSGWTDEPVAGYAGPEDDAELIERACASGSAAAKMAGKVRFVDLWQAKEAALAAQYPDEGGERAYDGSAADAALAQHLAFWTGNNCERVQRLMLQSALYRDKWEREDYLPRTIERAVSLQTETLTAPPEPDAALLEQYGAGSLRASSEAQRNYAESVRGQKLAHATPDEAATLCAASGPVASAKFWLDNADRTPAELAAMLKPVESARPVAAAPTEPEVVTGFQYLGAALQMEHFKGCVYVQDLHKVFTPSGALLKPDQFNATYGGYVFQLDEAGGKTTRKAWEAFTESQIVRFLKADTTCFRPAMPSGCMVHEQGSTMVNTYVPVYPPRQQGDPAPFLRHLEKLLPDAHDRSILLAYMAAVVQYPGVKFQWAPLIQGAEGNGKTLFTRCVAYAVGDKYTHLPPASEIAEKFNEWLFGKLFIGVEDVLIGEHKREMLEVLKPMLTNDRLAMRAMQRAQETRENYANFILNSNHINAIQKTQNDRRFAPFFTAQQHAEDLARDGMSGRYFPDLYDWLKCDGGYAIVAHFLDTYDIPDELNPAKDCHRAPETSSTQAAIEAGMGSIEQEVLEAVDEGRPGFAGGWISSVAFDGLLANMRRKIPHNLRRDLLRSIGYDWHPALRNGRSNSPIAIDGNKKPRLFIKSGHLAANLTTGAEVVKAYQDAQAAAVTETDAGRAFGNV